jgi:uncharacterized Fe-S cluster-containing protein
MTTNTLATRTLPGQNCGVCGYRTCDALAAELESRPDLIKRCINLSESRFGSEGAGSADAGATVTSREPARREPAGGRAPSSGRGLWHDSLDREFDFYLEHFPEEPGPREIILPHNPVLTREMNIQVGDLLIGRPLGMSCGCPITHCGVATEVDPRTGVIVWCVTGPLGPREKGFKDIGYYIAEGYEGLITQARVDIRIGMRYYFQPRLCMLQWRHSGLVNYINRSAEGLQVRVEGLWIG